MRTLSASACALLLVACGTTTLGVAQDIEVLAASHQCGTTDPVPSLTVLEGQAQLDAFFARLAPRHLSPDAGPDVDLGDRRAALIEMGIRPTGGYEVTLADQDASIRDGTLEIIVDWREADPDMMHTQALTSPCLLVSIPDGDYHRIEVRDRRGTIRGSATLR